MSTAPLTLASSSPRRKQLLEMLGSTEWHVRMVAAQALTLQALSGRDALEVTKRLLTAVEDQDTDVQAAAALALIHRDGPEITRTLLFMLRPSQA